MPEKLLFRSLATAVAAALLASTAESVTIDLVPVGNPSNPNDDTGYGSVAEPYMIGKYEVTAGQYTEFLNAVGGVDTYGLYNTNMWTSTFGCKIERYDGNGTAGEPYRYRVADDRENRPVNYVSWGAAARFSNWLHNGQPTGAQNDSTTEDGAYDLNGATTLATLMLVTRQSNATWFIPTEDQWYKAAYHKNDGTTGNYFDYPTSSDATPINTLLTPDPGNRANFKDVHHTGTGGTSTLGPPYYTTLVGEFENSQSPYGTFDQGGNVWEWNETITTPGSKRGLRGGYLMNDVSHLESSHRWEFFPPIEGANIGFRVASIPEPASITLLLVGLLTAMLWQRRRARKRT